MDYIEITGYVASVVILISLSMSNILKLRVINAIGAFLFAIYGYFLGAFPVLVLNGLIAVIDVYYLIKMFKTKDEFDILEVNAKGKYLNKFYNHYKKDISSFFTLFSEEDFKGASVIFVLRNICPVNLIVYKHLGDGVIEIILDYAIPEYRDLLNGQYLVSMFRGSYIETGCKELMTKATSPSHEKYLIKLGFNKNDDGFFVQKI